MRIARKHVRTLLAAGRVSHLQSPRWSQCRPWPTARRPATLAAPAGIAFRLLRSWFRPGRLRQSRRVIVLPRDAYIRQRLIRHHRAALAQDTGVPSWQRPGAATNGVPTRRRGRRLRLLVVRLRPQHGALVSG